MSSRSRILAVLGIVSATQFVIVESARADQTTGVLTGRVTDTKTGQPLRDVAIVVTSNSLQGEQSVVTDASGFYRIPGLPAGVYNVQMFRGEFKPFERTGVRLSAGQSILINGSMVPVGSNDVNLEVEAPHIDTGSSSTGVNLGTEFLRRVPLVAPSGNGGAVRSFEAVAKAAPGVVDDNYGASLAGATSPENNFLVNGVSTRDTINGTNGSPLSIEFMDEVQIITGSYLPEYGLNTGGTISATVKRGSNEFHGHTWANFTPGSLVGKRKEVVRNNSSIRSREALQWLGDIGGDIGGPIVKDKLWFYAGIMVGHTEVDLHRDLQLFKVKDGHYETNSVTGDNVATRIPGSRRTFDATGTAMQAVLNLTYGITPDQKLDLLFTAMPSWEGGSKQYRADPIDGNSTLLNPLNGTLSANSGRISTVPLDASVRWTVDADNKSWTFEQMAGWHHETFKFRAIDGSMLGDSSGIASQPQIWWRKRPYYHGIQDFEASGVPTQCGYAPAADGINQLALCPVDTYFTGGPANISNTVQNSLQLRQTTTKVVRAAGHHEIKLGLNYNFDTFDNNKGFGGGVWLRESQGGTLVQSYRGFGYLTSPDRPVFLDELNFTTKLHTGRAFLQDSWSIMDKVTVNAGVLYDNQTVIGGMGNKALGLHQQFSPRLGFVWDPTQDGRAKIRASVGRYYQSLTLDLADRAGTPEPSIAGFWAVGADTPCGELSALTTRCEDLGSMRTDLWGSRPSRRFLGVGTTRVPIDRNIKAAAKDELSLGGDWEFISNFALGADFIWHRQVRAIEDMSRDEGNTYFIGNPGEGIAKDFPKAVRDYKAFIFRFDKKMADHWMVQANYTLSYLNGNYNGLFRGETNQLDPNITSDFDLISLLKNRKGTLEADVRHNIKIFASGEIPLGERWLIDLGGAFTARSGGPTNYWGSHPLYGVNESFLLPRGGIGDRTPWVFNINARGGVAFAWSKTSRVSFGIDAFNLFNFQQATRWDNMYSQDDRLRPQKNKETLEKEVERIYEDDLIQAEIDKFKAENMDMEPNDAWKQATTDTIRNRETAASAIENSGIVEKNFHRPTIYQAPRQVTFSLRFHF